MENDNLSSKEKAGNHSIGRILNSHVTEVYPLTTKYLKANEIYFSVLEKYIDEANDIMISKIHEGQNKVEAREYVIRLAYEAIADSMESTEDLFKRFFDACKNSD